MVCEDKWKKFDVGCYYISTSTKTWNQSREYCVAQGGDLMVVDSQEEQVSQTAVLSRGGYAVLHDNSLTWASCLGSTRLLSTSG